MQFLSGGRKGEKKTRKKTWLSGTLPRVRWKENKKKRTGNSYFSNCMIPPGERMTRWMCTWNMRVPLDTVIWTKTVITKTRERNKYNKSHVSAGIIYSKWSNDKVNANPNYDKLLITLPWITTPITNTRKSNKNVYLPFPYLYNTPQVNQWKSEHTLEKKHELPFKPSNMSCQTHHKNKKKNS